MSSKKTNSDNSVKNTFGNNVRIRVCGLLFENDNLLLIKHKIDDYFLWAPPGGGVEFGDSIEETLVKEFIEETGLSIKVLNFLFLNEHIEPPLHAIELFYQVESSHNQFSLGIDPEFRDYNILQEIKFVGSKDLAKIDHSELHSILKSCINPIELLDKRGQLK